jgi:hypothetical protein
MHGLVRHCLSAVPATPSRATAEGDLFAEVPTYYSHSVSTRLYRRPQRGATSAAQWRGPATIERMRQLVANSAKI